MSRIASRMLLFVLVGLSSWHGGCSAVPRPEAVLHESNLGRVVLERMPNPSLQTMHPLSLDSSILEAVLRGLQVTASKNAMRSLLTSEPHVEPAF